MIPRARDSNLGPALQGTAAAIGLIVGLYVIGLTVMWVRLGAARLPAALATTALTNLQIFGTGLQSAVLTLVVFALLCALAYVTSAFRWEVNGQDWHDVVRKRGVARAKADPTALELHDRRKAAVAQRKLERSTKVATVAHDRGVGWLESLAKKRVEAHRKQVGVEAPRPQPLHQAPLGDGAVRIIAASI